MAETTLDVYSFEKFDDLPIKKDLLRGLFGMNFFHPSEIQKKSIIPFLNGKDIIAQAQSGTGKTCCFAIGILNLIEVDVLEPQAVVIAPTRELAIQIKEVIDCMGSYMELRTLTMIGGTALVETKTAMTSGCHVVVGTPGRIADMINRKIFVTKSIKMFVLDEADEMLDRGFVKDIRTIFGTMPPDVQVGLFSATLKEETMGITQRFMRDPLTILVKEEELTLDGIRQY